jgi:DNA-binding NarL/FixJ family response regulator
MQQPLSSAESLERQPLNTLSSTDSAPPETALEGPALPAPPIRVLLAEDHVMVRAGICALLESLEGVEVVAQASNGDEVLLQIAERAGTAEPVSVAILDISMQGMNGLEAAAHLARLHPQTRIIMLSMHSSEEYVLRALRSGAAGYLLKDAGFNELETAVRTVARGEPYLSPSVSRHVVSYLRRHETASPHDPPHQTGHSESDAPRSAHGDPPVVAEAAPAAPTAASSTSANSPSAPVARPGAEGQALEPAVALTPRQQEILRLIAHGLSTGQIASRLNISIKTVETHRAGLMARLNLFDIASLVRYAMRHGLDDPL